MQRERNIRANRNNNNNLYTMRMRCLKSFNCEMSRRGKLCTLKLNIEISSFFLQNEQKQQRISKFSDGIQHRPSYYYYYFQYHDKFIKYYCHSAWCMVQWIWLDKNINDKMVKSKQNKIILINVAVWEQATISWDMQLCLK